MKIKKTIVISFILVLFALLMYENLHNLIYRINSDFAAQIVFADIMRETNSILPLEWNFSTEIHISFASLFSSILLNFFSSWKTCYIISNIISYLILLFLSYKLSKELELEEWILWSVLLFMAPLAKNDLYYYFIGNEYLTYMIYELIFILLYLSMRKDFYVKNKINWKICMIIGVWSFFLGTMGMRYALSCFAPLLIVEMINFIVDKKENWQYYTGLVSTLVGGGSGYLVNSLVLCKLYNFQQHQGRYWKSFEVFFERLGIAIQRLIELFGYQGGALIFSAQGIINVLSFIIFGIMMIAFIYCLKQKNIWGNIRKIYIEFVFVANILNFLVLIMTCESEDYYNDIRGKYFILAIFLIYPIIYVFISDYIKHNKKITVLLIVCLNCSVLISSVYACTRELEHGKYNDSKEIIEYLIERDVKNGYASFWQANINMFYSNGELTISSVVDFQNFELQKHLTSSRQYRETQEKTKYFVWLTNDEIGDYVGELKNIVDEFHSDNYGVYICEQ